MLMAFLYVSMQNFGCFKRAQFCPEEHALHSQAY
jgi:hypothetical protein